MAILRCLESSHITESDSLAPTCQVCGSPVLIHAEETPIPTRRELDALPPGVWRYKSFLPPVPEQAIVTLGEGATPLLRAEKLGRVVGLRNLYLKDETRNPTGSFMDRGSTVLVSLANGRGVAECACVTTGNLGASLSAYCARAGIRARVALEPSTDQAKLYQVIAYGAKIEATPARIGRRSSGRHVLDVAPRNPYFLEGEKTTGLELVQDLGWEFPDAVIVPVGTGGHISMTWQAMADLKRAGLAEGTPSRLYGVRPREGGAGTGPSAGRNPEWRESLAELEQSDPAFGDEASRAMSESRGRPFPTTPAKTLRATGLLAKTEGIFAEPSSASVVAALEDSVSRGEIAADEVVVCVITGAGLKDPRAVTRLAREAKRVQPVGPSMLFSPRVGRTKVEILRILVGKGGYGYDVWRSLRRGRGISTASVYQHLAELEEVGLIRRGGAVVAKGRERLLYEVTRKGDELLRIAGTEGDLEEQ